MGADGDWAWAGIVLSVPVSNRGRRVAARNKDIEDISDQDTMRHGWSAVGLQAVFDDVKTKIPRQAPGWSLRDLRSASKINVIIQQLGYHPGAFFTLVKFFNENRGSGSIHAHTY